MSVNTEIWIFVGTSPVLPLGCCQNETPPKQGSCFTLALPYSKKPASILKFTCRQHTDSNFRFRLEFHMCQSDSNSDISVKKKFGV